MTDSVAAMATDPFADPIVTERDIILASTLAVGENTSLTLAQDQLIVLDDTQRSISRCLPFGTRIKSPKSIPYYNILSASLTKSDVTITFAEPTSKRNPTKSSVAVATLIYSLNSPYELAEKWVPILLSRAYGPAQQHKRMKVLINPFGGVGKAEVKYQKYVAPIFAAAGCIVDVEMTKHRKHAMEIAESLDINAYDVVCCASGDGLPMEVFNGLGSKKNATEALRKVAVVQLPCGSGNAMSWNLNGTDNVSLAALAVVKGVRTPLDLASITQLSTGGQRTLSFLSQSIGIIAETDLGTDSLRWMGDLRFTLGLLVRLLGKTLYPVDIAVRTVIDNKDELKRNYAREMAQRKRADIGSHDILDEELEVSTALGLPPLMYGTVADLLPSDKVVDEQDQQQSSGWSPLEPYLNLGNFYCGNMCYMAADTQFFTAALPNDGMLDLVTIDGDISRLKALGLLLDVSKGRLLDQDLVCYRKVSAIRVVPRFGWAGARLADGPDKEQMDKPGLLTRLITKITGSDGFHEGYFSVDGEKLPFEPFQIEIHSGLGTVLSKRWGLYEYDQGPAGWEKYASDDTNTTTAPAIEAISL